MYTGLPEVHGMRLRQLCCGVRREVFVRVRRIISSASSSWSVILHGANIMTEDSSPTLGDLLDIVSTDEPSAERFAELCVAIGPQGGVPDAVVDALLKRVMLWPDRILRRVPPQWAQRLVRKEGVAAARLCNVLEWTGEGVDAGAMEALASAPELRGVRVLDMRDNPLGSRGGVALARTAHMRHIRSLGLQNVQLGDEGLRALANSSAMGSVHALNLRGNAITHVGAAALASSPYIKDVRILDMSDNPMGDEGMAALAHSVNLRGATALRFDQCGMGAFGVRELAGSEYMQGVVELSLKHNALDDAALRALADSPHLVDLDGLALEGNTFTERGMRALATSEHLPERIREYWDAQVA